MTITIVLYLLFLLRGADPFKIFVKELELHDIHTSEDHVKSLYNILSPHITDDSKVVLMPISPSSNIIYAMTLKTGHAIPLTYSRDSYAMFIANGFIMATSSPNNIRIDYSLYDSHAGYLLEKEATNIIKESPSLEQVARASYNSMAFNGWRITPNTSNVAHRVLYNSGVNITNPLGVSIFLRASGVKYVHIRPSSGGATNYCVIDLTNATATQIVGNIQVDVKNISNGFCRVTIKAPTESTATGHLILTASDVSYISGLTYAYAGNGTDSYIYSTPHMEFYKDVISSPIPIETTTYTRTKDSLIMVIDKASTLKVITQNGYSEHTVNPPSVDIADVVSNGKLIGAILDY